MKLLVGKHVAIQSKINNMRKAFLVILILLSFQKIYAQTDEIIISQLISELLDCSSKVDDTLFFDQHINNTFFHDDSISFKKKTGLEVPQKTLAEIINNSKKINSDNKWKEGELNKKIIVVSRMNDTTLISGKPFLIRTFYWMWLFILPTGILGFLAIWLYFKSSDLLPFSIFLGLFGIVNGIILAECVRRKYGLDNIFSRLMATPDIDGGNILDKKMT